MFLISFETPNTLTCVFQNVRVLYLEFPVVQDVKQGTVWQMDIKDYEKLLHRQKMESHKRFFR